VAADVNLAATFSEPIAIGSGNLTLKNLTDGPGGDILIAVTDGSQVSVSGSVLTINPAADLLLGKDYAVRIDATAINDLVGNSYAGISDDATWFFSTPAPPPVGVVFFDNFEAGANPSALPATAGSYSNTPDVSAAQSTGNTSGAANTALWVRANQGFGATRCGLVDESAGAFADPAGEQAFAFRYTNSGLTTAFGVIGSLTAGTTYTVSFDVVADTAATPYNMQFVTFNGAGTRNDIRSDSFVSKVLASRSGNAPGDGSYQTVSPVHSRRRARRRGDRPRPGHPLQGRDHLANIDNVSVTTIGPAGPGPVASAIPIPHRRHAHHRHHPHRAGCFRHRHLLHRHRHLRPDAIPSLGRRRRLRWRRQRRRRERTAWPSCSAAIRPKAPSADCRPSPRAAAA
jgi:hypothetical protein